MDSRWWGYFRFRDGETRQWRIGPFCMWISRLGREFRKVTRQQVELDHSDLIAGRLTNEPPPEDGDIVLFLSYNQPEVDPED